MAWLKRKPDEFFVEYKICYGAGQMAKDALNDLQKVVERLIEEKWEPQGGLSTAYSDTWVVTQAMMRRRKLGYPSSFLSK